MISEMIGPKGGRLGRGAVLAAALAAGAMLAQSGGAAAQSADWDAVVAAAKKEGQLTVYNGTNFRIFRELAGEFQKEYGINVDVLDARASEVRERLRTEQAAGRYIADTTVEGRTSGTVQMR